MVTKINDRQELNILHSAWYHANLSFLRFFFIDQTGSPAAHVTIVHGVRDVQNVSLLEIELLFRVRCTIKQRPNNKAQKSVPRLDW